MSTAGIDHIAMPTANAERLIAFYKKIGFHINDEDEWRAGNMPAFSIQVGDSKINVHPEGYTASLRGPTAVPGSADICFVWDGTAEECERMLNDAGVEIISGQAHDAARCDTETPSASTPATRRKSFGVDDLRVSEASAIGLPNERVKARKFLKH